MFGLARSVISLLAGIAILLLGVGMQGTLLALRAGIEGFSVTATGVVMSAYFFGYALGTHYCPPLIRQVGYIRAFAVLATVASAAAVSFPLLPGPFFWFMLRLITGYCVVGLFLVVESWLNQLAPREGRGRFFAIYMITTLLAMAAGQFMLLLGDIAATDLFALTTILISLALVPIALTRVPQPPPVEAAPLRLRQLHRQSPTGAAGGVVAGIVNGGVWGMTPLYVHGLAADPLSVALVISLTIAGGATLQWPLGHLSDRFDRRLVLACTALSGALVALLGYWRPPTSLLFLLVGGFLFGAFVFSLYGLSSAHINDRVSSGQMLDASRGLLQLYGLGAGLGPVMAGPVMERLGQQGLPLFMAGFLVLLAVYSGYRLWQREAVPLEQQVEFMPLSRTSVAALNMDPRLHESATVEDTDPPA